MLKIVFLILLGAQSAVMAADPFKIFPKQGAEGMSGKDLLTVFSMPNTDEKISLAKKYGYLLERSTDGLEVFQNKKNRYDKVEIIRDPNGMLNSITHFTRAGNNFYSTSFNIPNSAVSFCGFNKGGKLEGCYTQSQTVCERMHLKNREKYLASEASKFHENGISRMALTLPPFIKAQWRAKRNRPDVIPNAFDPKNKEATEQVCSNQLQDLRSTLGPSYTGPAESSAQPAGGPVGGTK